MKREYVEVGTKYGKWTVLEDLGYINGHRMVRCRCECGNEKDVFYSHLKRGNTQSCGKCNGIVHVGDTFGKWTVLEVQEHCEHEEGRKALCQCECGTVRRLSCYKLLRGRTLSCGCWRNDAKSHPRLYRVYQHMMARCYNPNNPKFKDYGARGIIVCEEWKNEHGFDKFAEWALQNGYDKDAQYGECTLDRKDVNGNYEPGNCRFVNLDVQANNKQNTIYLTYNNETHTISEWGAILNIPRRRIETRYTRGYPIEDILFCGNLKEKRHGIKS